MTAQCTIEFRDAQGRTAGTFAVTANLVTTVYPITPGIASVAVTFREPQPEPPPTREDSPEFRVHVLRWLRDEQGLDAASVEKVRGYGSDWAGDTEGGFYPESSIEIAYTEGAAELIKAIREHGAVELWIGEADD